MLWTKKQPIRAEAGATILAGDNGPAKFSANPAYSGGVLKVAGYRNGIVVDLAGLVSHRKVIANLDHEPSKRVGHITEAKNDGRTLSLDGLLSASTPFRDEVIGSHQDGFGWDVSVEIQPSKIELVAAGKSVSVNGQTFQGPIEVARKSTLYGLAFVGTGADEANAVRIAAEQASEQSQDQPQEQTFESWSSDHGISLDGLNEQEVNLLKSIYEKQSKASEPVAAVFDADIIRGEFQKSVNKIEGLCLQYEDSISPMVLAEIKAKAQDKIQLLKAKAGEHEYTGVKFQFETTPILAEAQLALIRAERPKGPGIISSSKELLMNSAQVIEASLHIVSGREDLALKAFGEQTTEAARKTGPRSLIEACEASIRAAGLEVPRDRMDMIKLAMRPIHAAGFSTVSLPNILSNTMGRTLEQAYMETTASWRPFATIKSAADFKDQQSIRPTAAGNLEKLGAAGEIKHQHLTQEATYNWSIDTWATMETLTRRDIINDNLSYFNERPTMHGIAAGRTLNDLVWRTIMAYSFVNTLTSGSAALGIFSLVNGVAKMKTQKDSKGNSIDIVLNSLCVPPELEGMARQTLNSAELVHGAEDQGKANPAYKIVPNLVVEPRLSNSNYTNYSAVDWYLFGGPISSAVIVGFLNNQELPKIETSEADFSTLGMSLRCYHDFGVAMGDGKASLKASPD